MKTNKFQVKKELASVNRHKCVAIRIKWRESSESKAKAKMKGIGKVSLNLAEMVSNELSQKKLSITFNDGGQAWDNHVSSSLKSETLRNRQEDAFYVVDSLGERFFEGCNQGYILKFDESSFMYEKTAEEDEEEGEVAEMKGTKRVLQRVHQQISCCNSA